jgi:transposase
MGASNYTYAEATFSQGLENRVMSHARCFEFLGKKRDIYILYFLNHYIKENIMLHSIEN